MEALYFVVIPVLICFSPNHVMNTIQTESFFEWVNADVLYYWTNLHGISLFGETDFEPVRQISVWQKENHITIPGYLNYPVL